MTDRGKVVDLRTRGVISDGEECLQNVDDVLQLACDMRKDKTTEFSKATQFHLIYKYINDEGETCYGFFDSGTTREQLLWILKKIEKSIMDDM